MGKNKLSKLVNICLLNHVINGLGVRTKVADNLKRWSIKIGAVGVLEE
ncbi:hypothetical protein [Bacillus sp. EB600]|nr:hypothetical protein [Bacillus sp. EB600]MCQ6280063.1 hypothetical protein [Bacillus sp. EB600]